MHHSLRSVLLLALFLCSVSKSFSQSEIDLSPKSGGEIINHHYYKLAFSEKDKQALWVFYKLTPEFIKGETERTDDFRSDPSVLTGSSSPADYKNSGYDRGHLCPAGDMKLNKVSMSETFFMSNMSPQAPYFNRGIWEQLEAKVRNWALVEKELYIVTGPVFRNNKGKIGSDHVTVPGGYYKVLYDPVGTKKMIAFVLPNEKRSSPLKTFVVSVDSVESLTNIDFFPELPDEIENKLESQSDFTKWDIISQLNSVNTSFEVIGTQKTKKLEISKTSESNTYNLEDTNKAVKHYTNSKGERVQSPTYYKVAPSGASAECRDGTYSFSRSRRGTCSHHGGVKRWL